MASDDKYEAMCLARDIVLKLGGTWRGDQGSVPGFGHSRHDRSISIKPHPTDPADVLVHSFGRDDWRDVKSELCRQGLLLERTARAVLRSNVVGLPQRASPTYSGSAPLPEFRAPYLARERASAGYALPRLHSQGARYRSCSLASILAFHPHARAVRASALPALVAAITDPVTGEFKAVHRIYLRSDGMQGRSAARQQKMSLGPSRSGAVVLGDLNAGDTILEGEGIETTLTVVRGRPACLASQHSVPAHSERHHFGRDARS